MPPIDPIGAMQAAATPGRGGFSHAPTTLAPWRDGAILAVMLGSIFSAIIGFYMATVAALFGGATDAPATTTDAVAETPGTSAPMPGSPKDSSYTQGKYYAEGTYKPTGGTHDKLIATVVSGSTRAPLTVEFTGEVSSTGYSIEYGDGQRSGPVNCRHLSCPPTPTSSLLKKVQHTYLAPGTYVAKLRRHYTTRESDCAGATCNIVATATIVVTNPAKVCLGYKDGNLHDFKDGETTTVIPGGYLEKGYFLCSDGAWERRE